MTSDAIAVTRCHQRPSSNTGLVGLVRQLAMGGSTPEDGDAPGRGAAPWPQAGHGCTCSTHITTCVTYQAAHGTSAAVPHNPVRRCGLCAAVYLCARPCEP